MNQVHEQPESDEQLDALLGMEERLHVLGLHDIDDNHQTDYLQEHEGDDAFIDGLDPHFLRCDALHIEQGKSEWRG